MRLGISVGLACLGLLLLGCTHTTELPEGSVATPAGFSTTGTAAAPSRWWTRFDDAALTAAVETALAGNLDLAATWQRLQAANAAARRAAAERQPEISGGTEASAVNDNGDSTEELELALTASYELDLWGRLQSRADAERLRADATAADYQAAAISIAAQTATTWLRLADSAARMQLLQEQLTANERVLSLLETRLGSGLSGSVDVLRQRQLVVATRQQLNTVEAERDLLKHQLAILQGRAPKAEVAGATPMPTRLPNLPELPATGIPAELVERRPDTRAAFLALQAANREVAAAVSERYPRLAFDASLSTAGTDGVTLFEQWALSLGGNLTAPLLDFDRRKAEVDRTKAEELRLLHNYGQSVLTAFLEVEDALLREARQVAEVDEIRQQVQLAERAYEQLQVEYLNGLGNFIDVLRAQTESQQLQRELLTGRQLALEYRVALYRALAGDVETQ